MRAAALVSRNMAQGGPVRPVARRNSVVKIQFEPPTAATLYLADKLSHSNMSLLTEGYCIVYDL